VKHTQQKKEHTGRQTVWYYVNDSACSLWSSANDFKDFTCCSSSNWGIKWCKELGIMHTQLSVSFRGAPHASEQNVTNSILQLACLQVTSPSSQKNNLQYQYCFNLSL